MNKRLTINLRLLVLYMYAFVLIYLPDLSYYIKMNGLIIYILFTVLYLIKYGLLKDKKFINTFKRKPLFWFIVCNILFTIYYAIRTAFAGTAITDIYNLRIIQNLTPILILVGVCIVNYELDKMKFDRKRKYKFIINVAVIQSIIAISMILIPSLRQIAYNIYYKGNTESAKIYIYITMGRLYGICDGDYTYSLQILMAFLALFTIAFAYFYKEKKYYLISIFILFTTILNGRTGIVIYIVGVLLFLSYMVIVEHKIGQMLKIIASIVVIIGIIYGIISSFIPTTMELLRHGVNDVLNFSTGNDSVGNETAMLLSGRKLPEGIFNKIFGAGYRIYGQIGQRYGYNQSSDIGFVNDIFMAGIFSIMFLYGPIFVIVKAIIRKKYPTNFEKFMSILLVLSMIMSNYKGEIFRSKTQIATVLIILIVLLMEGEKEHESRYFNIS